VHVALEGDQHLSMSRQLCAGKVDPFCFELGEITAPALDVHYGRLEVRRMYTDATGLYDTEGLGEVLWRRHFPLDGEYSICLSVYDSLALDRRWSKLLARNRNGA
jgi:hypothetical protein